MSALELIQAVIDGKLPGPTMAETIPMRIVEVARGHVKLLRAIPLDQELIAEGKVIHVSRSLGVSEGSPRDAGGTLLARATCTCAILRRG